MCALSPYLSAWRRIVIHQTDVLAGLSSSDGCGNARWSGAHHKNVEAPFHGVPVPPEPLSTSSVITRIPDEQMI